MKSEEMKSEETKRYKQMFKYKVNQKKKWNVEETRS